MVKYILYVLFQLALILVIVMDFIIEQAKYGKLKRNKPKKKNNKI